MKLTIYDSSTNSWEENREVVDVLEKLEKLWFRVFSTIQVYLKYFECKRIKIGTVSNGISAVILATAMDKYTFCRLERLFISFEAKRLYLYYYSNQEWCCVKEVEIKQGCFVDLFSKADYFTLFHLRSRLFFWCLLLPIKVPFKVFCELAYKHVFPDILKKFIRSRKPHNSISE